MPPLVKVTIIVMPDMVILEVPFSEKESAKALGAKWNARLKKWCVPEGKGVEKYSRWIPSEVDSYTIRAISPFYLMTSHNICWKCEKEVEVISFAAEGVEEEDGVIDFFITFSYIALIVLVKSHRTLFLENFHS